MDKLIVNERGEAVISSEWMSCAQGWNGKIQSDPGGRSWKVYGRGSSANAWKGDRDQVGADDEEQEKSRRVSEYPLPFFITSPPLDALTP